MARINILVIAALLALTRVVSAGSTNWPPAGFVEVRAYLYNLEGEAGPHILKQGNLPPNVWNPEGVKLSKAQIATVQKAVVDYYSYGSASCYMPRHAFVYYDAEHKPIGFVEICFSCNGYRTYPENRGGMDFPTLKRVFKELKIPVFDNDESYLSLKK